MKWSGGIPKKNQVNQIPAQSTQPIFKGEGSAGIGVLIMHFEYHLKIVLLPL